MLWLNAAETWIDVKSSSADKVFMYDLLKYLNKKLNEIFHVLFYSII